MTLNNESGRGHNIKYNPHVFTESGLYMLMTVLRGELATAQSKALIRIFKSEKSDSGYIDLRKESRGCQLKKLRKTIRSEEMKKRKLGEDLDSLDFLDDGYDKDYEKLQGEIDQGYDRIEKAETEMEGKMKKLSAAR